VAAVSQPPLQTASDGDDGRLFALPGSEAAGAAGSLAWLWRLGGVRSEPAADAVGFGTVAEAAELTALVAAGRLAGVVLFASGAGPALAGVPERQVASGVAGFGPRARVSGDFTVFRDGAAAARSSLGVHAVRDGRTLVLGVDPATAWTQLRAFWSLRVLADFLPEVLERPLVTLPAVGCARVDDLPGTAQLQVEERAKPDWRQQARIRLLRAVYGSAGARLNVAVASGALADGEKVALDEVWPRSTAVLAAGVRSGAFEPVCHGWLHLDPDELERGNVQFREFLELDETEAGRRLDAAVAWQETVLGARPATFVAPAWGYSEGTLAAAAARGLPAWQRPALVPMLHRGNPHESVDSGFRGMQKLDYRPFAAMAALGLPPTPVLHGGLFDLRVPQLRGDRDFVTLVRLLAWRDILRLPRVRGVRWVGAGELIGLLRDHDRISVRGAEVRLNDARHALLVPSR
jgi:hypothetical protein